MNLSDLEQSTLNPFQKLIFSSRTFIFLSVKQKLFNSILNLTTCEKRPEIKIERLKAMKLKTSGKTDTQAIVSVFGQLFRELDKIDSSQLRNNERAFKITFKGEGAVDLGGPYSETFSYVCDELMSKTLKLLIPTPNHVHNTGENRESWILNPTADSQLELQMFEFLGKLIGFAIRTQNNLNLMLPSWFWKRLVLENTNLKDFKGVDESCWQMIEDLKVIWKKSQIQEIGDEDLSKIEHLYFEVHDSSGKLVELVENGAVLKVEPSNLDHFIKLVEDFRMNEAEEQFKSLRKGISCVAPFNLLCLFTGKQVEDMACGIADIDVEELKGHSEYQGIDYNGDVVKNFWEILKEMSPKDKSLFLRFVWGRSRLPLRKDYRKFKITGMKKAGNPDSYLPVAHTCFFQIDLPKYSSKEIMKQKILYATNHCRIIDLDAITGVPS